MNQQQQRMQQMQMQQRMQQQQQGGTKQNNTNNTNNTNNNNANGMNLLNRMKGGSSVEMADESSGNKLAFTCVFRTTPRGGDLSNVRCLLEAVRHSLNLSIEQERKENLRLGQGVNVSNEDQRKNALVSIPYFFCILFFFIFH